MARSQRDVQNTTLENALPSQTKNTAPLRRFFIAAIKDINMP